MTSLQLILVAILTFCLSFIHAQAPEGINYQAVARSVEGNVLVNQSLTVRMTINENGPVGTTVFQETHNVSTNDFGLFDLTIGQGSVVTGTFSSIGWGSASHFLQVEVDDGSGYVNLGTSQFVSVPYALYAKEAGNGGGTSYTAGSGINISGNVISNTGDTDASDDITTSSTAGGDASGNFNNLTVVGLQGRSVSGSAPASGQVLKWNGSSWAPANDVGGGSGDNWGSQVVQSSPVLSGDGTNSNPLDLSQQGASTGQVLKWNGSTWAPANDVGGGSGDNWGSQVVQTDATLSGNGTAGNALGIAPQGASNGQVLMWNGSNWVPSTVSSGGSSPWSQSGSDIYYNSGKVGIGVTSPLVGLHVQGGTNILIGDNSEGQGNRVYWNANKGAFRSGLGYQDFWDDENTGAFSFASGSATKASGRYSTAMGVMTKALEYGSTAMGEFTTASDTNSIAFGNHTTASGKNATSIGFYSTASGNSSIAMGDHTHAYSYVETVIGSYSTSYTPGSTQDFHPDDRLFTVGNGIDGSNRSDAMVVLKNGNVGIGDSDPYSRLRVSGEAGFGTPLVDFEAESISQYQSVLYLSVPSGSSSDAKFIEMMSGFVSRASIKEDGSARFKNVRVTDELSPYENPDEGTLYNNSLPVAYGQLTASASIQRDYGIESVNKLSTGVFRITTNRTLPSFPIIIATCYNTLPGDEIATGNKIDSDTIEINISDGSGNPKDSNFYFMVY